MGLVIVLSLPLIIFSILLAFCCYFIGRAKGRQEMKTGVGAQVYGMPTIPPGAVGSTVHEKKKVGSDNV
ncbi:hypothetical protein MA16_Dca005684 [Dendrobium catenatum]|uniref:Uncharacterized protein n=1 Tax=Dendrobium catenatum TaxID=906689 RepID=A0A2I0WQA5_9ASPA|nr:hypothetical protein MA16_Dca005684 [Dendrobium catenatum]